MRKKFSKKQIAFILVAICLVGLIGIGISYSYYLANISTSNSENKNSDISSATITQVVMDMQGKVSSDGAYPGHKAVKEVIVRGIGESNSIPANASIMITPDLGDFKDDVTWKLYKSDEAITCSSTVHTDDGEFYEDATCNIPSSASLELEGGADSAYKNIVVNPNTETKYYLVIEYVNKEIDQSDQMGKSFNIDIGLGEYLDPVDSIIAQLDTTGKCPTINNDETVNITSAESTDGYLCSAKDDYGTSYYYRGNVTNNYVKFGSWSTDLVYGYNDGSTSNFYVSYYSMDDCQSSSTYNYNCTKIASKGDPMYWRIVRINGDKTVRMIYDGTVAHANGESSPNRQAGDSEFNYYWRRNNVKESSESYSSLDNAGVGYMYGNRDAIVEATNRSYTVNYQNTTTYYIAKECTFDITTGMFLLKDPIAVSGSEMSQDYVGYYTFNSTDEAYTYHSIYKITDITSGDSSASVKYIYVHYGTSTEETAQTNTNDSEIKEYLDIWYKNNLLGKEEEKYLVDNSFCNSRSIYYGTGAGAKLTDYRWYNFTAVARYTDLRCMQQNDAFTVSDTDHGNGALTYPIGLITTDEVVLAGGYNTANTGFYLYSGVWYWTLSPNNFSGFRASNSEVSGDGKVSSWTNVNYFNGSVKPVINISKEILNQGDGSMSNPYRIE